MEFNICSKKFLTIGLLIKFANLGNFQIRVGERLNGMSKTERKTINDGQNQKAPQHKLQGLSMCLCGKKPTSKNSIISPH